MAIALAVEEGLGKRQGKRTDLEEKQLPVPEPEVPKGKETRDFIAQRSGFGTGRTMQQARKVVQQGSEELVQAMDRIPGN